MTCIEIIAGAAGNVNLLHLVAVGLKSSFLWSIAKMSKHVSRTRKILKLLTNREILHRHYKVFTSRCRLSNKTIEQLNNDKESSHCCWQQWIDDSSSANWVEGSMGCMYQQLLDNLMQIQPYRENEYLARRTTNRRRSMGPFLTILVSVQTFSGLFTTGDFREALYCYCDFKRDFSVHSAFRSDEKYNRAL